MKKILLALMVILAVASMSVGATFAGFCDTETSEGNKVETSSLDLKVAKADELEFCDDQPWGTGLFPKRTDDAVEIVPCFMAEEDETFAGPYICNLKLWNAGSADGKVYIHIKDVATVPEGLLGTTNVVIWCDLDDDGEIDEAETVAGTLQELACLSIPLDFPVPPDDVEWLLPANAGLNLTITIDPPAGAPGNSLTFDIQFGLIGIFFTTDDMMTSGFCDTEICLDNYLEVKE